MDKLVQRYAKSPVTSAYSSRRYAQEDIASEEYGYALPLGRGIERCPAPNFEMPATVDPTSFLQLHTDDASDPSCRININHGTTTLAFKFQVGIVVAVDSRATTGSYIASGTVKKVIRNQPLPARNDGRRCCRLPVLGDVPRHPEPPARVAESQADLGHGNKRGPRLLAQQLRRSNVSTSCRRTTRSHGIPSRTSERRHFANLHRRRAFRFCNARHYSISRVRTPAVQSRCLFF
ncbi:hypothetical protein AAT19DRAFT_9103 [Rhodotorula toruloides]|uniref:Uncharacterized protein n=1 Tax=Rhodotorula toruloides TaxID=5286 RepID=A0A2T0AJ37_RHOTO|nr:hypothetical protein AAT19DRAFT_9103 [Rhodotorula toruloides]